MIFKKEKNTFLLLQKVEHLLTSTVTTRRTTPRMLFSSFLSVSDPFRPVMGFQQPS